MSAYIRKAKDTFGHRRSAYQSLLMSFTLSFLFSTALDSWIVRRWASRVAD